VLKPGGRLLVIDLAAHQRSDLTERLAHRWPGFADTAMKSMLRAAGMEPAAPGLVHGPLEILLWPADVPRALRLQEVA